MEIGNHNGAVTQPHPILHKPVSLSISNIINSVNILVFLNVCGYTTVTMSPRNVA
jgi:hypothetical protein